MRPAGGASPPNHQDPYIRSRENPYFNGLLKVHGEATLDSQGRTNSKNDFRSVSDIGDIRYKKLVSNITEKFIDLPLENSAVSGSDIESFEHSSSERWLKTSKTTSFVQLDIQAQQIDLSNSKHLGNDCSLRSTTESDEECHTSEASARASTEKTYMVAERKESLSSIPLPLSAAAYYNGYSPEMEIVESCQSIGRLNAYLRARRDDVNAGVPGRFLHAVMGLDAADVGTVASTIMYAFYQNETMKGEQFCTVPIINTKRANLGSHAELKWLLDSCQIDQRSLLFADEIDLSYYDLFGSLKIVLLKSSRIANRQEKLKEAVVDIFHCRKGETVYPWVKTVTTGEECSSCTAIAEKFAMYSPEILASKAFSKVLLAGILLDTKNLSDPRCTSKDKYMASLLINGAGRYGCSGLYQLLKYKMHDVSTLQVADILRKDFKKWTVKEGADSRSDSQIGMSCIGISIGQLLAHTENLAQEIRYFQYIEKLQALIIVSGYYDAEKKFKREILVCTETVKLLESLLFFFDFNASKLPLKSLHQPGLKNEMKAFEIDKITSRKTIEQLIEEFVGI